MLGCRSLDNEWESVVLIVRNVWHSKGLAKCKKYIWATLRVVCTEQPSVCVCMYHVGSVSFIISQQPPFISNPLPLVFLYSSHNNS